jgi:ankyrin repeat protein
MLAVEERALPLVDIILANAQDRMALKQQKDVHGDTALHLAALTGSKEIIAKLLEYGFSKEVLNNVMICE